MNQSETIIDEPGEYITRSGAIAIVLRPFDGTGHQWEGVINGQKFPHDGSNPFWWQSKGSVIHAQWNNTGTDGERSEDIVSKIVRTLPTERSRYFAEI